MAERVARELRERTDRVLDRLDAEWAPNRTVEPFDYGPLPWHPDQLPETVDAALDVFGGMSSVVVFWSDRHVETVLVWNRHGHWEPPGGVIEAEQTPEETAVTEAREETGLEVQLTGLHSTGRVTLAYEDGNTVELPVTTFVGDRVEGSLRVEREVNDHPGVTRGAGLFDREHLPAACRDREDLVGMLEPYPDERRRVPDE